MDAGRLDRAALIHGAVALRHPIKRQCQIKNLPGINAGTAAPGPSPMDVDGVEQLFTLELRRRAERAHSRYRL
jgi:hypothetical protein